MCILAVVPNRFVSSDFRDIFFRKTPDSRGFQLCALHVGLHARFIGKRISECSYAATRCDGPAEV